MLVVVVVVDMALVVPLLVQVDQAAVAQVMRELTA